MRWERELVGQIKRMIQITTILIQVPDIVATLPRALPRKLYGEGIENTLSPDELDKVLKAARASQKREITYLDGHDAAQRRCGVVEAVDDATRAQKLDWRENVRARVNNEYACAQ